MSFLAWLGALSVLVQLSVAPALWAAGAVAGERTLRAGVATRILLVLSALCGLATGVSLIAGWPVLAALARLFWIWPVAASLGAAALLRFSLRAIGMARAPRLGDLPEDASVGGCHVESALEYAADALGLANVPSIRIVQADVSPAVTGFRRPVLLFPARMLYLSGDSLRIVVTHELAHLKMCHLFWSRLAFLLRSAIWPNPLGTAVARAIGRRTEIEADGLVEELGFSLQEIGATRRQVLSLLSPQEAPLAFVSDESAEWRGLAAGGASVGRACARAVLVAVGLGGALCPLAPIIWPRIVPLQRYSSFADNPFTLTFGTSFGDWGRAHYDVYFTSAGALCRMRGDGRDLVVLDRSGSVVEPCVSRDGSRVAFVRRDSAGYWELCVRDRDGREIAEPVPKSTDLRHPSLSPTGDRVVYSDRGRLVVLNLATGRKFLLPDIVGPGIEPSFGHDGSYLLYMIEGHVFRVGVDGRGKRQLTFGRNHGGPFQVDDHGPMASPDGKLVALTRVQGQLDTGWYTGRPIPSSYTVSVWVMNADGSDARQLTKPVAGREEQALSGFAPTGLWVSFELTEASPIGARNIPCETDVVTGEWRALPAPDWAGSVCYTGFLPGR
jgi:Zn-dependent protease with chaperone function